MSRFAHSRFPLAELDDRIVRTAPAVGRVHPPVHTLEPAALADPEPDSPALSAL